MRYVLYTAWKRAGDWRRPWNAPPAGSTGAPVVFLNSSKLAVRRPAREQDRGGSRRMPSLLTRCDVCRQRPAAKPAQVTTAWLDRDRHRHAYRQRVCIDCYTTRVLAYEQEITPDASLTCPACGIDTDHDYEAVFVTSFLPGVGKVAHEFPFCGAHAAPYRAMAQENAERLEDREPQSRGQAPGTPPPESPWAALGIEPNV